VFSVRGHDRNQVEPFGTQEVEPVTDRGARSPPLGAVDYRSALSARRGRRVVGRSIVDDDDEVAEITRDLRQQPFERAGFVKGGDDDPNLEVGDQIRLRRPVVGFISDGNSIDPDGAGPQSRGDE
jgi:hypothetical protein